MSPASAALAALLFAGHALGDFVLQTRWMIERKNRSAGLLAHVATVAGAHLAMLAPWFGVTVALAIGAVAAAHLLVDIGKGLVSRRWPERDLEWFTIDQALHVAILWIAWRWLAPRVDLTSSLMGIGDDGWFRFGVLVTAYAFNLNGMSAVVTHVLARLKLLPRESGPSAGRLIGVLERMFAVTLVYLGHWDALGFLVAAKSLARFRDLDERRRAEYYLVGTLVSLFGATLTALILRAILG
ncbi:MAG: DUF3307 domain-containing protein [bacterium]